MLALIQFGDSTKQHTFINENYIFAKQNKLALLRHKTRKLHSQQKRGTRKKILASALKKNKEFKEKTSTIEHVGVVSRGVDSNFQIEGRRLID